MKISNLSEGITQSSSPDNMAGGQAPKFGRSPDVLEDEQLEETSAGATGSGSVASVSQAIGGIQKRGKGSIFSGIKTSEKFPNSKTVKEGAYEDGISDGMRGRQNPRASSIYGPETSQYDKGFSVGIQKGKEQQQARQSQQKADSAPYEQMSDEELIQLRKDIQQRGQERQKIYQKLRGADYSFDYKRHTPPNHNELKQQGEEDNKAWNIINQVLWRRGINIDKLGESVDPWGPQGNFAGDTHVDIGGISMKPIAVGDTVKYFGEIVHVLELSKDKKVARIEYKNQALTKNVRTSDLVKVGQGINEVSDETIMSYLTKVDADSRKHKSDPTKRSPEKANKSVSGFSRAFNKLDARKGVAEADKLQGTPVVSLKDFGDEDNTKDKYGRTVPKKLKKDDPRVKFHKDPKQQGVAEGFDRLDSFTRKVLNRMEDDSWLSAERAYFIQKGAQEKAQTNRKLYDQEIQRFIDLYKQYKGQLGVAEDKDPCWDNYKQIGMKTKNGKKVPNCVPKESIEVEEDWQKVNKSDKTDGMSPKAVKAYRRENPGSKLKTAVTTKPSKLKKGSKDANRRKSFCARMGGMKKAHASAKTKRDPDSPINKALRRWNCESVEELQNLLMIAEQKVQEARKLSTSEKLNRELKRGGFDSDASLQRIKDIENKYKKPEEKQEPEKKLDEKSKSKAQFRFMAGVAHNPEFAKKVGVSKEVGQEFHKADRKQDYSDLPAKVDEAELSEEQLIAKQLAKQLELFKRAKDTELSNKPKDKEIQAKQLDELFGFGQKKPQVPVKPMQPPPAGVQGKDQTWMKGNKQYTLRFVNPGYTLIDPTGKEIQRFNAPIRYIESHLEKNGFKLANTNPEWFKV